MCGANAHAASLCPSFYRAEIINNPVNATNIMYAFHFYAASHGRPYLAIEVRQDQILDEAGQARWAGLIAEVAHAHRCARAQRSSAIQAADSSAENWRAHSTRRFSS